MKRYRPIIIIPLLLFVITACVDKTVLPPADPGKVSQQLARIDLEFQVQAKRVKSYMSQPPCDPAVAIVGCADATISAALMGGLRDGNRALDEAWTLYLAGKDVGGNIGAIRAITNTLINRMLIKRK